MKKLLIISSFFIVLMSISTIGYKLVSANEKLIEEKDELKTQKNKEEYITPYGYTLDNPNLIINPYGISPLTAIILFETPKEEEVTITVEGKDQFSTYTNTFNKATKHYIPIYGLYSNKVNKVYIKCGKQTKILEIKTEKLPKDLIPKQVTNISSNLYFITSDTYPYALDNNNEVRWYLTKKYSNKISRLKNGNLLLSTDTKNPDNTKTGLVEIDLLGKIYKQYNINEGYYGSYAETSNSLLILSKNLIELDKQNGIILNEYSLKETYNEVFYNNATNIITLSNSNTNLNINKKTKEKNKTLNNELKTTSEIILPFYNTKNQYKIIEGIKLTTNKKTKESKKDIFLVGYKKIDNKYKKYNVKIIKTEDNLQIKLDITKKDTAHLILDKFLDKRVYDLKDNYTIINKEGLKGKYSIYIKINNTIYKTDNYIKF